MSLRYLATALAVLILSLAPGGLMTMNTAAAGDSPAITIIPRPASIDVKPGAFVLGPDTVIGADGALAEIGSYTSDTLSPALGAKLAVTPAKDAEMKKSSIVFKLIPGAYGDEGYLLETSPASARIEASAPAGAFYAVQSLRQLLPAQIESRTAVSGVKWSTPCVRIKDAPRFKWRGLMLDSGRHFKPKEEVLKFIDVMSLYKMNTLHFHLTDDQGWRIEIKKYPALTEIGAWRGKSTPADELSMSPTGPPHGGFYTQDDIREIVAYATKHFITVVPEIEMPGHSQAALASVPGLACVDAKYKVWTRWGVNREIFCAGNDKTFEFLEDVLTEVAALFPGPYIHIGGDEVPKDRWKACPKCQARIKAEGLKDEAELQSWFIKRIEKFLDSKGKKLIGWDEILEGGLPPRATVMSWRGVDGGIKAATEGHDVVMSPTSHCYLDYYQTADRNGEPRAIGGLLTLDTVYSFEPVPPSLSGDLAKHVLGTQGNLWSEFISTSEQLEYMAFPRAQAVAENGWTQKDLKDFNNFAARLKAHFPRFQLLGINFRMPKAGEPGF